MNNDQSTSHTKFILPRLVERFVEVVGAEALTTECQIWLEELAQQMRNLQEIALAAHNMEEQRGPLLKPRMPEPVFEVTDVARGLGAKTPVWSRQQVEDYCQAFYRWAIQLEVHRAGLTPEPMKFEPQVTAHDVMAAKIHFSWSWSGVGFGQLSVRPKDDGTGWVCGNECLNRDSVKKLLVAYAAKLADVVDLED
jgi:hypothetical protein